MGLISRVSSRTYRNLENGKRPKSQENLLPCHQEAPKLQGHPVQKGQRISILPGSTTIYPKTERLWWSDQADLSQESQDHQKDCFEDGNHLRQGQEEVRHHGTNQEVQILRTRR